MFFLFRTKNILLKERELHEGTEVGLFKSRYRMGELSLHKMKFALSGF